MRKPGKDSWERFQAVVSWCLFDSVPIRANHKEEIGTFMYIQRLAHESRCLKWKKVNRDFYASRLSVWLKKGDHHHGSSPSRDMATLGDHWIHQPKAEWLSGREMKVDGKKDWVVSYLWIYTGYTEKTFCPSMVKKKQNTKGFFWFPIIHLLVRDFSIFQPIALPTTKLLGGSFHVCASQP